MAPCFNVLMFCICVVLGLIGLSKVIAYLGDHVKITFSIKSIYMKVFIFLAYWNMKSKLKKLDERRDMLEDEKDMGCRKCGLNYPIIYDIDNLICTTCNTVYKVGKEELKDIYMEEIRYNHLKRISRIAIEWVK